MKTIATILMCFIAAHYADSQTTKATYSSSSFIQNQGQIIDQKGELNADVLYVLPNGQGMNTQLRKNGFSYDIYSTRENGEIEFNRIDIDFIGSNNAIEVIPSEKQKSSFNYYRSGSAPYVQENVSNFNKVTYKSVYPNIDVIFKVNEGSNSVKYDIIVHPGADLSQIQFQYSGAESLAIKDEALAIKTNLRVLQESIPLSYYEEDQSSKNVTFTKQDAASNSYMIGFSLSSLLDVTKTLVIDPVPAFTWGKYIGDSLITHTNSVITDRFGFVYICGSTQSLNNIATAGAYQTIINDSINDAYVTKYNNYGNVIWSTYFGGEANDVANDVYVDTSFNVFIAGATNSFSGIIDSLGYQDTLGGTTDAFIAKFTDSGTILWSSYFGGDSIDVGLKLSVDFEENVYLAGYTMSDSSIVTDSSFQNTLAGDYDGFIVKFDEIGDFQWSSYLGGSELDMATGVSFGDTSVFVSGVTYSSDFPVAGSVYQDSLNGNSDGFLARITKDGDLLWATYFGGEEDDNIRNVKAFNNNIYFIGSTDSDSSIATVGSSQEFKSDSTDAFVTKMDHDGVVQWSSYFGGDSLDLGIDLFFELDSNIVIFGMTESSNLPFIDTNSYQENLAGESDGYLAKMSRLGDVIWSTYYGGNKSETAEAVAVYGNTAIYVVGSTYSDTVLIPDNQIYPTNEYNSYQEGYFTKFRQNKSTMGSGIGGGIPGNIIYICPGEEVLLTVDGGELGTDANWIWYEGQCGNTTVMNTGDSILVYPMVSTTYFVRAESITNATDCISITINVAPSAPIEITSDSLTCSGTDFLLAASGGPGTIDWTGPNAFTHSDFDTTLINVTDSISGWYFMNATDTSGCMYADSINLSVTNPPSLSSSMNHVSCFGYNNGQITLDGPDLTGYEYQWVFQGPPVDTLVAQDTLNDLYAGTYELIVTDSNNCSYQETIIITEPLSVLVDTLITPTACMDSTGSIALAIGNYLGTHNSIWEPTAQTGDTITSLQYGWHDVTIILENKCVEEYSFFVPNVNGLEVNIDSTLATYCEGTPSGTATAQALNGIAPYTYEWFDIGQTGPTAIDLDTGSYVVTVYDDAGCYAYDTVTIEAIHSVTISGPINPSLCSMPSGSVDLSVDNPNSTYTILHSFGGSESWSVIDLPPGQYTATIVDTFGCQYDFAYTIGVINDLQAEIIPGDTIIEMGTDQQLEVTTNYSGNFSYTWNPITDLSCGDCYNPIITPMQPETYEVIVFDSLGCIDTALINIDISIPCIEVFVPTVFSPNGDQLNDVWNVIGTCVQSVHSRVYNQWGQLVFESHDQQIGWDGYYLEEMAPIDQYTFVVDVIYANGTAENFSGFVTLIH